MKNKILLFAKKENGSMVFPHYIEKMTQDGIPEIYLCSYKIQGITNSNGFKIEDKILRFYSKSGDLLYQTGTIVHVEYVDSSWVGDCLWIHREGREPIPFFQVRMN